MKILGISGSLRKNSYNTALLRAAADLLPAGTEMEIAEIGRFPLFNQEMEVNMPQSVLDFKAMVRAADAILFATPEYNYSISGALKNAIDWGSRPYGDNCFDGKPAAIISASPGAFGGARAQYHLRQILLSLNVYLLNKPEVMVSSARKKFDEKGILIDEETRAKAKEQLKALAAWAEKFSEKK